MFKKNQKLFHHNSLAGRSAFQTAALIVLGLAGGIATSGVVFAHPEMDRCGRDITSGPWPVECKSLVVNTNSTTDAVGITIAEATQSTGVIRSCGHRLFDDCPPEAVQTK
jgi:hypothetical protein